MKPIKLKDLLEQAKNPKVQQIEIVEDYVLSVKTVFEGVVKDVPEEMLSKYYISDWCPEEGTPVLVVLVWVNPHEQFKKTWQGFPLIHVGEELPHILGCTNVRTA